MPSTSEETRRFKTQGKVEALLYQGSFPLDFLRRGEQVGCVPGRGMDGSCQIEGEDFVTTADPGDLIVRDADGLLYVLTEIKEPTDV